jgi:hypothetical protein
MTEITWQHCIFCDRRWDENNLELELCPECLDALRRNPMQYNKVQIDMLMKFGDFKDEKLARAVKLMWEEMSL